MPETVDPLMSITIIEIEMKKGTEMIQILPILFIFGLIPIPLFTLIIIYEEPP